MCIGDVSAVLLLPPMAMAREVLGHSSLAITNTYIHVTDAAKRGGTDALARLLTEQEASVSFLCNSAR